MLILRSLSRQEFKCRRAALSYNGCPDNKNIFYIFFFQFFTVFLFYRIWFGRNGKRLGSNGNETNSVDLYEIMMTIQEHLFLQDVPGVKEHFWNMFIMDALIGNTDRNNSNWGIILRKDGSKEIAPVYDNGNCLNSKWDDEKMRTVMNDADKMEAEAYKARRCIFELQGKRVNPYHIIESREYPECSEAAYRLGPKIGNNMDKIQTMIKEIPILSEMQKRFFTSMIEYRYEKVLLECIKSDCAH